MTDSVIPGPRRADTPADAPVTAAVYEDFDAFYGRDVRGVIGLAYVLSGSRSGAEDLAQEAFLAAYRHWSRVGIYDNPGAWVRRVVANNAVSTARRRVSEAKSLVRLRHERVVVPELAEDNEALWAAVRRLPRRQAQVVALCYWDGLNGREIAEILDLSEPTVKSHLQRARQSLADNYRRE